jgi:hypothetical protein
MGIGFLLGTPLMSHHTILDHTYHFPSLLPSVSLSLGILECIDARRGCPSFYGKKGPNAERDWCWVKDKSLIETFQMLRPGITQESSETHIFE